MSRRKKMIPIIIIATVILSIATFVLLAKFYTPLNRYLFGGEVEISSDEIRFWIKKVPNRNYYKVYVRYLRSPETELPDFGHAIFFKTKIRNKIHGSIIAFNPEDNKIYGGGWSGLQGDTMLLNDPGEWQRVFYCLSGAKIESGVFKPIFPQGTKFTFCALGILEITSAPRYYITIYLPINLKKIEKEELEKGILTEIVKDAIRKK